MKMRDVITEREIPHRRFKAMLMQKVGDAERLKYRYTLPRHEADMYVDRGKYGAVYAR